MDGEAKPAAGVRLPRPIHVVHPFLQTGSSSMAEYIEVEKAIPMQGLRVVLSPGLPAPWSESCKGILQVKSIPYTKVRQDILGANEGLIRWTAQATAPSVVWNNDPARSTWIEQLYLFERLAPTPRLIPQSFDERTLMVGLAHEICGEDGFTWHRRNIMVRDFGAPGQDEATRSVFRKLGEKYWYTEAGGRAAPGRCAEILEQLATRLRSQRAAGSPYFIGSSLTALDIYWACHAVLLQPLPDAVCPMPALFRSVYTNSDPVVAGAADPILLEHRDFMYKTHLHLPLDF